MRVRDSQLPHPSTFRGTVREFIGVSVWKQNRLGNTVTADGGLRWNQNSPSRGTIPLFCVFLSFLAKILYGNPETRGKWSDAKSPRKHMAEPGIMPRAAKQYFDIFTMNLPSSPAPTLDPLITDSVSCNGHVRPACGQICFLLLWACSMCEMRVSHLADNHPAQRHLLRKSNLQQLRGLGPKSLQASVYLLKYFSKNFTSLFFYILKALSQIYVQTTSPSNSP